MKVPPKRKGNGVFSHPARIQVTTLNESPSEKEGKFALKPGHHLAIALPSMKVPPKRKGNPDARRNAADAYSPSMKVPPKRKGNGHLPRR